MRILVTGGWGRLGKRLVPLLRDSGNTVFRPTRSQLDLTDTASVSNYLELAEIEKVVALAAYTNVVRAETDKRSCIVDTVSTASTTAKCCAKKSIPMIYLSTDYVIPLKQGIKSPFYSVCKLIAEGEVKQSGASIVRVAFVTPEQVEGWKWANNYTISNRWWVEDAADNLCRYINLNKKEAVVNLGPDIATTNYQMLVERYPHHPAVSYKIDTNTGIKSRAGIDLPKDTSFPYIFTDY